MNRPPNLRPLLHAMQAPMRMVKRWRSATQCPNCTGEKPGNAICPICHSLGEWYPVEILALLGVALIVVVLFWLRIAVPPGLSLISTVDVLAPVRITINAPSPTLDRNFETQIISTAQTKGTKLPVLAVATPDLQATVEWAVAATVAALPAATATPSPIHTATNTSTPTATSTTKATPRITNTPTLNRIDATSAEVIENDQIDTTTEASTAVAARPATGPSYPEIEEHYLSMSRNEWRIYRDSLIGTRIRWRGIVVDINSTNFRVDAGQSASSRWIIIDEINDEILAYLNEGDEIEFEATIYRFKWFLGLDTHLNDVRILSIETE